MKPANIKVRHDGTVKILDFGLAKVPDTTPGDTPTITAAVTEQGVILGTAAYMSPEQAGGTPVDKRTDIWSFGCVLFEMLAGRRPFEGSTASHVVAAVLKTEPDWASLPVSTPPSIRRLIRRCLAKDRTKRAPDIGMARLEIEEASADDALDEYVGTGPSLATTKRSWAFPLLAAALGAMVSAVIVRNLPPASPPAPDLAPEPVRRFEIPLAPGERFGWGAPALSPDGRFSSTRSSESTVLR